jgi:catecholate siderophore receptor
MLSVSTAILGPDVSTDGAPPAVIASSAEATALPSIQVYGSATASDTDLPQSVDTVDRQEISEQGITRLQDALRNVPGITLNAGEGGSHGDSVNLRGLSVPDSFFLDGLRDIGQYQRDTFNLDSVAVLLGPSSVLFGRGSTAGVVNGVSKQPTLLPLISATASVGTAGLVRGTGDFNWVLGDTAAARVDVMDEHAGVAERDEVRNRRSGLAPTIALGIATPTRLTVSFLHQGENNIPDYGIPFIDGAPARVKRSNYYGLADYDRTSTDTNITTAKFEHDFNDDVTLSNTLRAAHYGFTYLLSAPHLDNDFTQPPAPGTPLADILIYRDQPSSSGTQTQLIDRTDLVTHFDTGPIGHSLITGIELSRETSNVNRYVNGIDAIAPTPLLDPNPYNAPPTPLTVVGNPDSKGTDVSIYAIDSLSLTPKWDLDAGLRWDRFNSYFNDTLAASAFARADMEISPRAALVYKPDGDNSVYLSYGTSYNPAIEYLTLAPTSASLAPEKDRSFELGTKWQWMSGRLSAAGALFDAKLSNARIADPDDPTVQQQPFDQRVIGVELGIAGHVTERWGVKAGYTHLDDRIVATSDAPALGRVVPNTPRDAFDMWATFTATSAWTFAGGVNYAGYRYADTHNSAGVPAYAVFNAMAAYRANQHLSFQLNLDNLTNKLYFSSIYYSAVDENHAVPGAGRSLILSASVRY